MSLCVCVRMSESVCGILYVCHVSASVHVYECVRGVLLCASFCLWYAYVRVMCRIYDEYGKKNPAIVDLRKKKPSDARNALTRRDDVSDPNMYIFS